MINYVAIILQRVSPEHIKHSFHNLHSTISKLNAFLHFITDVAPTSFQRIGLALNNIMEILVRGDFEFLNQHLGGLAPSYGYLVERIQKVLDETMAMLTAIVNGYDPTKTEVVYRTMKGHAKLLIASFNMLSFMNSYPGSVIGNDVPNRAVSDHIRGRKCQTFQTDMKNILKIKLLTNTSGRMFEMPGRIPLSESDMNELYKLYKMYTTNECVRELPSKWESLVRVMYKTNLEILQVVNDRSRIDDTLYMENKRDNLHKLYITAVWLSKQLKAYSENKTAKIELSKVLTHSMFSGLQFTLDHIVTAVERKHINPLLSMTNRILWNINNWYIKSMNVITALLPFYDNSGIDDKVRSLKIWRHPMVRFKTADILQFKYQASESWQSWGLSTTLEEFVLSGTATKVISTTIEEYRKVLQSELTRIGIEYKRASEDVIRSFKDVIDDFRMVHKESVMGSDFIL